MALTKITHKASGVSQMVTPGEAKALKANPRFNKVYSFEEPVKAPAEIEKTVKPKVDKTKPRPETTLGDPEE